MSIRWKLTIMFITLVFLVMMVTGTFIIMSLRFEEQNERAADLAALARDINTNVIAAAFNSPYFDPGAGRGHFENLVANGFQGIVTAGRIPSDAEAFLISGETRATLGATTGSLHLHMGQVVIAALSGQHMFLPPWQANNPGEDVRWFEYAMPVYLEGSVLPDFVIYIRSDADNFLDSLTNTTYTIGFGVLISISIASVLALVFSSSLTQNLLRLNRRIKEFKVGAGSEAIAIGSIKDEIGQLSESFSTMT
ncbi:MAG: cell wall metabolism sensor histidine kinase WalK, partial [Clostridiales bacterium]|nr:cell wall metabolism sensor histidine kinase WalK [Clostridiales bacterium]